MRIIESHTIGEPTRIIIDGGPDLGNGPLAKRRLIFSEQHDSVRRAICNEPRGHDGMVGGLLCEPHEPDCDFGIIFFNNHGTLGMCIHGTIGLVATLRHLGLLTGTSCRIDTPVGPVAAQVDDQGRVTVTNVPSHCLRSGVQLDVAGYGKITGDIAWGGNWFFLIDDQGPTISATNIPELTHFCTMVRDSLKHAGITSDQGEEIDHIELFGPPHDPTAADSRNFVLCPGGAYDRSPCGTGLSAKIACLAARGTLKPGQIWRQASIINHSFEAFYSNDHQGLILPHITGQAWVNAETTLWFDATDPFRDGLSHT